MQLIGCPKFMGRILASFGVVSISCPGAFAQNLPDNSAYSVPNTSQVYSDFDLGPVANSVAPGGNGGMSGASASGASQGDLGTHTSAPYQHNDTQATGKQDEAHLLTRTNQLDKVYGGGLGNLPRTVLDSFVKNAGGNADLIYGDEGDVSIPPFFTFDDSHRIERGIHSGGLTTGHKGDLPEAWGWPQ